MAKQPTKLLTKAEVCARIGVTAPTLWRWVTAGHFPRGCIIGTGPSNFQRVGWIEHEVEKWINDRPRQQFKGDQKRSRVVP